MEKRPVQQLNLTASEIAPSELTPVTSNEGDYSRSPISSGLHQQTFYYDPAMAQSMYQQQQFNLQYQADQNMYPVDQTQAWPGPMPQQSYIHSAPSSLPEQSLATAMSTTASTRHDYVPLAKRPSIAGSIHSTISDGEDGSTHDEASERRRERRRAQNRAAQRAFRARKEDTIKESSTRLDALQDELARLHANNSNLSETVSDLRTQIATLQRENAQLKRNSTSNLDWDAFDIRGMNSEQPSAMGDPPDLKTELSNDSGVFDLGSSNRHLLDATITANVANESETMPGGRSISAAMIAEAIVDAAAALKPR